MAELAGQATDSAHRIRVIYILGSKNSGSTLLETVLSQDPKTTSVGEFNNVRSVVGPAVCNCGRTVDSRCGDCRRIAHRLNESTEVVRAFDRCVAERGMLGAVLGRRWAVLLKEFSLSAYREICDFRHVSSVIDSSKNVCRAAALRSEASVSYVHIIRRPESYVQSRHSRDWVHRKPTLFHLASWSAKNLLIELFALTVPGRIIRVPYERLVREPTATVTNLAQQLGLNLESAVTAIELGTPMSREHTFEPARRSPYRSVTFRVSEEQPIVSLDGNRLERAACKIASAVLYNRHLSKFAFGAPR